MFLMFLIYQSLPGCQVSKHRISNIIFRNCTCGGIKLPKNCPNLVIEAGLPTQPPALCRLQTAPWASAAPSVPVSLDRVIAPLLGQVLRLEGDLAAGSVLNT
jgi:hypothetical protein